MKSISRLSYRKSLLALLIVAILCGFGLGFEPSSGQSFASAFESTLLGSPRVHALPGVRGPQPRFRAPGRPVNPARPAHSAQPAQSARPVVSPLGQGPLIDEKTHTILGLQIKGLPQPEIGKPVPFNLGGLQIAPSSVALDPDETLRWQVKQANGQWVELPAGPVGSASPVDPSARSGAPVRFVAGQPYALTFQLRIKDVEGENPLKFADPTDQLKLALLDDPKSELTYTLKNIPGKTAQARLAILEVRIVYPALVQTYQLTVNKGSASLKGSRVAKAPEGEKIALEAQAAPEDQIFDTWTGTDQDLQALSQPGLANIVFTMPDHDVSLTATYKDDPDKIRELKVTGLTWPEAAHLPTLDGIQFATNIKDPALTDPICLVNSDASHWERLTYGRWEALPHETPFVAGEIYRLVLVVSPHAPYSFAQTCQVTLDGRSMTATIAPKGTSLAVSHEFERLEEDNITVVFRPNEGQVDPDHPMEELAIPKGSLYPLPECAFKAPKDKDFAGWSISGQGTNTPLPPDQKILIDKPLTLSAQWQDHPYVLEITLGSATVEGKPAQAAIKGKQVVLTPLLPPQGQIFDRWDLLAGPPGFTLPTQKENDPILTFTMPGGDLRIQALYKEAPKTYHALQISSGRIMPKVGDPLAQGQIKEGEKVNLLPLPAPEGKVFAGWALKKGSLPPDVKSEALKKPDLSFPMAGEELALEATYEDAPADAPKSSFTLTQAKASLKGEPVTEASPGSSLKIEADIQEGQSFVGWQVKQGLFALENPKENPLTLTMPVGAFELEALLEGTPKTSGTTTTGKVVVSYAIHVEGGSVTIDDDPAVLDKNNEIYAEAGKEIKVTPKLPEHKTFEYWTIKKGTDDPYKDSKAEQKFLMGAETISLVATFKEIKPVTLVLDPSSGKIQGKEGLVEYEVYPGDTLTLPKVERPGYTFAYWKSEKGKEYKIGDVFDIGDKYSIQGPDVLTAFWESKKPGQPPAPQPVPESKKVPSWALGPRVARQVEVRPTVLAHRTPSPGATMPLRPEQILPQKPSHQGPPAVRPNAQAHVVPNFHPQVNPSRPSIPATGEGSYRGPVVISLGLALALILLAWKICKKTP